MDLPDLSKHASQWICNGGPHADVVISSRVRLARNLAGFPFLSKASDTQCNELLNMCHQRILDSHLAPQMYWVDLNESTDQDRRILVERHLISRQHQAGQLPRGVAICGDESFAIMVNEEDHLRISVLRSGMQLDDVYAQADQVDDVLESHLDFAYSAKFGYLTACPTNVGTGIRVSVMLHLPALKLTGEIEKVSRAARELNLAIRGFHGEGSEAVGDLYQISNQTTLGRCEKEIMDDFQHGIIPQIIEYEHRARHVLQEHRPTLLDDRIYRAWGTLTCARLLGSEETMRLLSYLRLGVSLGKITGLDLGVVNELFILTQPAHVQKIAGEQVTGDERKAVRAQYIRKRIGQGSGGK